MRASLYDMLHTLPATTPMAAPALAPAESIIALDYDDLSKDELVKAARHLRAHADWARTPKLDVIATIQGYPLDRQRAALRAIGISDEEIRDREESGVVRAPAPRPAGKPKRQARAEAAPPLPAVPETQAPLVPDLDSPEWQRCLATMADRIADALLARVVATLLPPPKNK